MPRPRPSSFTLGLPNGRVQGLPSENSNQARQTGPLRHAPGGLPSTSAAWETSIHPWRAEWLPRKHLEMQWPYGSWWQSDTLVHASGLGLHEHCLILNTDWPRAVQPHHRPFLSPPRSPSATLPCCTCSRTAQPYCPPTVTLSHTVRQQRATSALHHSGAMWHTLYNLHH